MDIKFPMSQWELVQVITHHKTLAQLTAEFSTGTLKGALMVKGQTTLASLPQL